MAHSGAATMAIKFRSRAFACDRPDITGISMFSSSQATPSRNPMVEARHPRRISEPSWAISPSKIGKDVAIGLASSTLTGAVVAIPITMKDMAIR